ncbi:energy transducer TonB [Bacillus subtilis subsp. subtilis]|nr:energy transducer TonB [Bacillus subtilis subsp. subtilis]
MRALLIPALLCAVAFAVSAQAGRLGAAVDIASKNLNPPIYPSTEYRAGIKGELWIQVHVDAQGQRTATTIIRSSGSAALDQAALQASANWTYIAALENGQPVAGTVRIPVVFKQP